MDRDEEVSKQRFNFLIIEDNEFNQLVLNDSLLDWNPNLNIEIANNGAIGLEMTEKSKYDMIFMDIQMPVMNGHEATTSIKGSEKNPNALTPIIAVTAHALKTEEEFCLENGMLAYITKPFDPEHLFETIVNILTETKGEIIEELETKTTPSDDKYTVIDSSIILKTTKGKPERLAKMVDMFLSSTPEELEKIKIYSEEKNYDAVRTLAHSFKPKYTYMGMPQLSDIAKQIEHNAATGSNLAGVSSLINELEVESKIAYLELKELLNMNNN